MRKYCYIIIFFIIHSQSDQLSKYIFFRIIADSGNTLQFPLNFCLSTKFYGVKTD